MRDCWMFIWGKESTLFLHRFYTSAFKFSIVRCIHKSAKPTLVLYWCVDLEIKALNKNIGRWETNCFNFHILHLICFNLVGYDLYHFPQGQMGHDKEPWCPFHKKMGTA